jgi:SAM-dependent methyltransferase
MARPKPRRKPSTDRHRLYQASVQAPEADIEFFDSVYRKHHGASPRDLREDFCGTALLSLTWAESDARRTALGIDLDADTLAWGRKHNLAAATKSVRKRVRLAEADVRSVERPKVDVACAMNFSFCTFKTREQLEAYLGAAYRGLRKAGVLVLELYGGTEAIAPIEERREVGDFVYTWEQETFNPIDRNTLCHIHFELPDGTRLERAFTYDWRLWTIPELREALSRVGFGSSEVYWETVDEEGEGTGDYQQTEREENQEGWLVYVVGIK